MLGTVFLDQYSSMWNTTAMRRRTPRQIYCPGVAPVPGVHPLIAVATASATVAATPTTALTTTTIASTIPLRLAFRLVDPDRPAIQLLPIERTNHVGGVVGFHCQEPKPARPLRVAIGNHLRIHHLSMGRSQIDQVRVRHIPR